MTRRHPTLTPLDEAIVDLAQRAPSTWPPPDTVEPVVNLSPHFTLGEMTVTTKPFPNVPGPDQVDELRVLCEDILEPWRLVVGRLYVSSGFRSRAVNEAVGGEDTSDHLHGRAADVVPLDVPLEAAWRSLVALLDELPVDQGIVYLRPPGKGWIHVGRRVTPRRELLVQVRPKVYVPWSTYRGPIVSPA